MAPSWMSTKETFARRSSRRLRDPNLALVLLVLGALGIYAEFTSPGLIVPGILGAILALVGLSAISILPINWLGAALLLLAFALFILEAKLATHGILGAGGALSMVFGAVMLIDSPVPEMRIHLSTAISLALPFSLITMLLLSLVLRARRNKVVTGAEGMLGQVRRRHHSACARRSGRQSVRPRRILGCRFKRPRARRGPRPRHWYR